MYCYLITSPRPFEGSEITSISQHMRDFFLGVWVMKGKQLFHGVEVKEWAIVSFAHPRKCSEDHLRSFTQKLTRTANDSGMPISHQPCFIRYARHDKEVKTLTSLYSWSMAWVSKLSK